MGFFCNSSCQSTIGRDLSTYSRGWGEDTAHKMLIEAMISATNNESMFAMDSVTYLPLLVASVLVIIYCSMLITKKTYQSSFGDQCDHLQFVVLHKHPFTKK